MRCGAGPDCGLPRAASSAQSTKASAPRRSRVSQRLALRGAHLLDHVVRSPDVRTGHRRPVGEREPAVEQSRGRAHRTAAAPRARLPRPPRAAASLHRRLRLAADLVGEIGRRPLRPVLGPPLVRGRIVGIDPAGSPWSSSLVRPKSPFAAAFATFWLVLQVPGRGLRATHVPATDTPSRSANESSTCPRSSSTRVIASSPAPPATRRTPALPNAARLVTMQRRWSHSVRVAHRSSSSSPE